MQHMESTVQSIGGLQLYVQRWQADVPTRAVIAIVHGFGEHSGRYMNLVNHLVPRGHVVCGVDLRGHGRSPGSRGHIDRWEDYREDLRSFLQWISTWEPARPRFVLGHSMGALIVLDFVLRYPGGLAGAIVSGVPLEPVGVASPLLVTTARLLSRVWPGFPLSLNLETAALSRDPEVVRAYEEDPLVHGTASARWGTETLDTIEWIKDHTSDVRLPLLMIHGGADRINAAEGTRRFFEAVTHPDKELRVYPAAYHEPHNDQDWQEVVSDVERWIESHAEGAHAT
ncbi:MAG: monoacylglycerol lipase [Anaerolineae bacterium]|nr:MAG: monoacylglycerol lipase [Anaerolineae bacterium]